MLIHEAHWQLRILLRDRTAAFFTLAFPIVLLLLLLHQIGKDNPEVLSMGITVAIVMASFPALAISLAAGIENGILHRLRSTPLPPRVHLMGRMVASGILTVIAVALVIAAAHLAGVGLTATQLAWITLPLVLGWAVASTWGIYVGAYARKSSTASFLTQILLFPLYILESFLIGGGLPAWLELLAQWSPLHQLVTVASTALGGNLLGAAWPSVAYLVVFALIGFTLSENKTRAMR